MERQKRIFEDAELRKRTMRARYSLVNEARFPGRTALKRVLVGLWSYYGENEFCWPHLAALGERLGYSPNSRRALQTKLYELQELGIVEIERSRKGDGRMSGNRYRILFENLAPFCADPAPLPEAEPREHWTAPANSDEPANDPEPCAQRGAWYASKEAHGMRSKRRMDTTYRKNQRTTTEPETNDWTEAAAALMEFGIERIALLIDRAKAAGVTPPRALELLAVATSAGRTSTGWKITPGMLFDRIVNDRQTLPPETGWHPDAQTLLNRAKARTAEETRTAIEAERTASIDAKIAADRNRRLRLLETYGPILDAMTPAAFAELCDRADLDHLERRAANENRRARLSLEKLIKHLTNQTAPPAL